MKLSNESRLKQLIEFKNDFNQRLEQAYKKYEENSKHLVKSSKTQSDVLLDKAKTSKENVKELPEINNEGKKRTLIFKSPFSDRNVDKSIKVKKRVKSQLKLMSDTWKPQYMVCDYFEKFKRLKDNYEMTNWERVNIFIINKLFSYIGKINAM